MSTEVKLDSKTSSISFLEDDAFSSEAFARRLLLFIQTEADFVEGSLVMNLEAPFGSGKTHFLRMWNTFLSEGYASAPSEYPLPVVLNAWEDDYCGDALIAVVSGLLKSMKSFGKDEAKRASPIQAAAKDVANFSIGLANSFVASLTGLNSVEAGKHAEEKKEQRKEKAGHAWELFMQRRDALSALKNAIKAAFSDKRAGVVIMVDELDRCRPDYAIQYLETVKHIFDVPGFCFVLATDIKHLESSARSLFGADLDFPEYIRKFVHRTASLPKITSEGMAELIHRYSQKLFQSAEEGSSSQINQFLKDCICEWVFGLNLNPRQAHEAFRMVRHWMSSEGEGRNTSTTRAPLEGAILMSCLQVKHPQIFEGIGTGSGAIEDIWALVTKSFAPEDAEKWIIFIISGWGKCRSKADIQKRVGMLALVFKKVLNTESSRLQNEMEDLLPHWNQWDLQRIYDQLKSIRSFAK